MRHDSEEPAVETAISVPLHSMRMNVSCSSGMTWKAPTRSANSRVETVRSRLRVRSWRDERRGFGSGDAQTADELLFQMFIDACHAGSIVDPKRQLQISGVDSKHRHVEQPLVGKRDNSLHI